VSKAFLKSKEMTDGLERSMFVMVLSREIIAVGLHGEPVLGGKQIGWRKIGIA